MIGATTATTAASAGPNAPKAPELEGAAKAFEAIFLRQMIGAMRSASLAKDELFGSTAGDQFRDMQDSRLADEMGGNAGIGIAQMLLKQFGGVPASKVPTDAVVKEQ